MPAIEPVRRMPQADAAAYVQPARSPYSPVYSGPVVPDFRGKSMRAVVAEA